MSKGWISLHRKILDNPILTRGRAYSRFEAFVYMLLKANHKKNKCVIGNNIIYVETGSFITSQKKLMFEFKWGISKLRGFLELLQNDHMIKIDSNSYSTMITIINYDTYQNYQIENKSQIKQKQIKNKSQTITNNKTNKINNANNITEEYFINQVNKIIESNELKYDQVMIKDFCSYWTEKNIGGFKMRFQKQNTFDINRRLKRWYSNAKDWDHKQKKLDLSKFKTTTTNKYIGWCDKCNISGFYETWQVSGDSRCCNSKINYKKK